MRVTKRLAVIFLILVATILFSDCKRIRAASLYVSPSQGSFLAGDTFDVSIFVDTEEELINAVDVSLKFNPQKIQVADPSGRKSFIEVWVSQPLYSNIEGTMRFIGGIPYPGIKTSSGLISTVTFRVIAPGQTSISFLDSSKVLLNNPEGIDILNSSRAGFYNLTFPPPSEPQISSPTHPEQNKWYKDNNPTFSWEKEENVEGFSYSFDQDVLGVPDNIVEGDNSSISYSGVKDGIWYFHIKAKKGEVFGGTSNYMVWIDTLAPAAFTPTIEPSVKTKNKEPLVFFITTDALSGLGYYQIKYFNIEREEGLFIETQSPYKMPSLETGIYSVIVRAYDKAGNWREEKMGLEIEPLSELKPFPWWIIILISFIIFIVIFIFFFFKKKRERSFKKDKILLTEREKLEDSQIEKIRDEEGSGVLSREADNKERSGKEETKLFSRNNFFSEKREK
jgi:hypothetical protein